MTLVTVMFEVAVAVLYAVVPPLVETSTFVPAESFVWSQARNVTLPVVAFCPSGMNRSLSLDRNNSAELSLTAPTAVQLLPLSVEYCHVPVPLLPPNPPVPPVRARAAL